MNNNNTTYKDSSFGKIPCDWEVKTLKDCCLIKGEYGINAAAVEYSKELPTYIRITDIDDDGYYSGEKKVSVNDEDSNNFILNVGDIVFARTGATVGKTYLYDTKDGELVFAGFLIRFRPNEKCLLPQFLKYFTSTNLYWNWVKTVSMRSGQPGINAEEYGSIKIPLPLLPEQKAIAHVLGLMDSAINTNIQLLAKKELQKKWLMKQLLSEKLIEKNEKWCKSGVRAVELWELGRIVSGGTPSTINEMYWNGEINWITPTDITALKGSKYLIKTSKTISEEGLKNSSAELIPENSIVITTRATIGEFAINKIPVATNQGFKSIVPDGNKVNTEYLYYLLLTKKNQLRSFGSGSTFFEVSKTDIFHFSLFIINSLGEQTAIAKVLQAADKEIHLLKTKTERLREQKNGLMQVLLTGKKRLTIKL